MAGFNLRHKSCSKTIPFLLKVEGLDQHTIKDAIFGCVDRDVFAEAAFFAVSAATIRRRPLIFYKKLLDKFERLNHTNPEIGHFMERFWGEIF